MTQTSATLKISSQRPGHAVSPESGRDPFPLPQVTVARPDVQNSSAASKSYPGHSPGLPEALNLSKQARSYDLVSSAGSQPGVRAVPAEPLDIPRWPQSPNLKSG